MISLDTKVVHSAFGEGTVVEVNGKYFKVGFGGSVKTFVYPDAFEKFLTLADKAGAKAVAEDLAISQEHKKEILAQKMAENRHAMEHGIVIPGKEIVPEQQTDENRAVETEEI